MNDINPAFSRRNLLAGAAAVGAVPILGATVAHADDAPQGRGRVDPAIRAMLREIDTRNIKNTINKLVSFGTRNTLSSQTDPSRGIGAARDWLFDEFKRVAAPSGGRMTVELQSYTQGVASRIPMALPLADLAWL